MNTELIVTISTFLITIICGIIAKKIPWFNNYLIPVQNISIGIICTLIYFLFTKDFNLAITTAGILAGGTYDIVHNIQKLLKENTN